jgi:hypothetical protein
MESIVRRRMESYMVEYRPTHRQLRNFGSILKPVRFDPALVRLDPSLSIRTIHPLIKSTLKTAEAMVLFSSSSDLQATTMMGFSTAEATAILWTKMGTMALYETKMGTMALYEATAMATISLTMVGNEGEWNSVHSFRCLNVGILIL